MTKFVAFLRAINVGGHTVKMEQLRGFFHSLGLANVETFIASGNVIFEAKAANTRLLESKIEEQLRISLGYEVSTFVRSVDELAEIARYQPFARKDLNTDGNDLFVCFLTEKLTAGETRKLLSLVSIVDDFRSQGREVYWLYRRKKGESKFYGPLLEKTLNVNTTVRSINTVKRMVEKYS